MKKISILAILVLLVGVVLVIFASKDVSSYQTFSQAEKSGRVSRIVGDLVLDKPIVFEPETDANLTTFYMTDEESIQRQVSLLKAKPQDFERAEKLVLTGKMVDGIFVAHDILMKCPSKYKDEEMQLRKG